MKKIPAALVTGVILASLVGCSGDEEPARTTARTSLEINPYAERVFEAYRQTGDLTREVKLPEGSRAVGVVLDCAGSRGRLKVDFSTAGGAEMACTPKASGSPGRVALSGDGSLLKRDQTITITGPNDQQWSVAIDAGEKVTAN